MHPGVRQIHSVCFGSRGCVLGVVRFIEGRWVHPGAPWASSGLFGVVGFTRVRSCGRRVHSGYTFGVIRGVWVHKGAP